jgi:hypothetical protein
MRRSSSFSGNRPLAFDYVQEAKQAKLQAFGQPVWPSQKAYSRELTTRTQMQTRHQ